jgi:hypothetical protein
MAALDFSALQQSLAEASLNESKLNDLRKAFNRLEVVVGEINHILSDDYQPANKERKPRVPRALGTEAAGGEGNNQPKKKAGRPKKGAEATAE